MNDTQTAAMRFVWTTSVAVEAATVEEAHQLIEDQWGHDGSWWGLSEGVAVYKPSGPHDDVIEADDEPDCICPPDLVERGGFRGSCPVCA